MKTIEQPKDNWVLSKDAIWELGIPASSLDAVIRIDRKNKVTYRTRGLRNSIYVNLPKYDESRKLISTYMAIQVRKIVHDFSMQFETDAEFARYLHSKAPIHPTPKGWAQILGNNHLRNRQIVNTLLGVLGYEPIIFKALHS